MKPAVVRFSPPRAAPGGPLTAPLAAVALLTALLVTGCGGADDEEALPPLVLSAPIEEADADRYQLPGAIRAARETPLSFRVAGQIEQRHVEAGARVTAGQPLLTLDPRDARQRLAAAKADLASARAQAQNAEAERKRLARVLKQQFISEAAYDAAATTARAAQERVKAAQAALEQAENALSYTQLGAPADGVLIEVSGEAGQTVAPGEPVAVLAHDGRREIEVFVAERRRAGLPERGTAQLFGGERIAVAELSEIAGAADPVTRTWRARYRLTDGDDWPLGASATLRLAGSSPGESQSKRVPLAAVVDKGDGPAVWVIREGQATPEPVTLLQVDGEHAYIATPLPEGTAVVAIGAHLLTPGQPVRTRS